MSQNRRRRFAATMVVIGSLIISACGGESADTTPGATTDESEQATTSTSTATSSTSDDNGEGGLIIFELSFPCGLNDYATLLCNGVTDAAATLPEGYTVEIKNGIDYGDIEAYNNLIQTSLELEPAGLIIFPNGPAAQVPVLQQACEQGVKIIIIDSPSNDFGCQSSFVGADHYGLGVMDGEWLVANPPPSNEVGIVTLPPGQFESNDARVRGFTETVEAAGFEIMATVVTDNSLDKTRTEVTNMLTAHPGLGAIFSANGIMAGGTAQALTAAGREEVFHLTLDGFAANVEAVIEGTIDADAAQNSYEMGKIAVEYMAKVISGEEVPPETYTRSVVVDASNAEDFLAAGADTYAYLEGLE